MFVTANAAAAAVIMPLAFAGVDVEGRGLRGRGLEISSVEIWICEAHLPGCEVHVLELL